MSQGILETSFFDSRPRLQGIFRQFYGVLTSGVNAVLLAALGVIVALAIAFHSEKFAFFLSITYGLIIAIVLIIGILLVLSSSSDYKIKKYALTWDITDSLGNYGTFTLNLDIVLNKVTDTISLFFPLYDYVTEIKSFSFLPLYFGFRKKMLTHLLTSRRVGTLLSLVVNGRRNIVRTEGNHLIEIPIDVQIDVLSVVIRFLQPIDARPELLVRHGARITAVKDNHNCNMNGQPSGNGYTITTYVKHPNFGCSYIVMW